MNRAFPSNGAIYPKKRIVIPLGVLVGFLMGFSFGFLRHYFDHTFKKPTDVEHVAELNVIFSIPFYEEFQVTATKSGANLKGARLIQAIKPIIINQEGRIQSIRQTILKQEERVQQVQKPKAIVQEEVPVIAQKPEDRKPDISLASFFKSPKPEDLTIENPGSSKNRPKTKRKQGSYMSVGLHSKLKKDHPSIIDKLFDFVR
jgi:hypothetical protein